MGRCVGYIGWKMHSVTGVPTMDSHEDGQVIWPKAGSQRQKLYIAGTRGERDPAFIPCHGSCSKQQTKWTWHTLVSSPTYKCDDCQNQRRWGFRFSF